MSVRERDNGARRLLEQIRAIKGAAVDVGVLGQKAAEDHGGLTVGDVATFHEFGIGVPERSFVRNYVDRSKAAAQTLARRCAEAVARGVPAEAALNIIGMSHAAAIQEVIADGIDPPLAPETIKRKGSSVPLIDTGQLRASVTWRIAK